MQVDDCNEPLSDVRFADDSILFDQCMSRVRQMFNALQRQMCKYGYSLDAEKTRIMFVDAPPCCVASETGPFNCGSLE